MAFCPDGPNAISNAYLISASALHRLGMLDPLFPVRDSVPPSISPPINLRESAQVRKEGW